jgi:hypothetical protein
MLTNRPVPVGDELGVVGETSLELIVVDGGASSSYSSQSDDKTDTASCNSDSGETSDVSSDPSSRHVNPHMTPRRIIR